MRAGARDPAPPLERGEIDGRGRPGRSSPPGRGPGLDRFPRSLRLPAPGRREEVDLGDPARLAREPAQLLGEARPAALQKLPVPLGEGGVVLVARLLEQAHHLRLRHVLDAIHAEQCRLAPVTLDLLGEPLELLVPVGRVGEEVGRAPERHCAQPPEPPPGAHAQAGRPRGKAQQQEEPGVQHMLQG